MISQQPPVIPRPLHDEDGTLRALARQMLADLDKTKLDATVPRATLEKLLTRLCQLLMRPVETQQQAQSGKLFETANDPQLARAWWRRENEDDDGA